MDHCAVHTCDAHPLAARFHEKISSGTWITQLRDAGISNRYLRSVILIRTQLKPIPVNGPAQRCFLDLDRNVRRGWRCFDTPDPVRILVNEILTSMERRLTISENDDLKLNHRYEIQNLRVG